MRVLTVVLVALASPSMTSAGGTFEIDLGGGVTLSNRRAERDNTVVRPGVALPALSAGARFGDTAIVGRIAAVQPDKVISVLIGVGVQWWPNDRVFFVGGFGVGQQQLDDPIATLDGNVIGYRTLALDLRAGVNLRPHSRHRITVSIELTPGIYPDDYYTGIALHAGYQYW